MNHPANIEIFKSEIAEFWFGDEGILYCNATPVERTIDNVTESFNLVEKITGGKRVCLLTDLTNTGVQSKKERDFAMEMLPRYYKVMAVITNSDFQRTIANIFLSLYNTPIPIKIFKTENEAKEWLMTFI